MRVCHALRRLGLLSENTGWVKSVFFQIPVRSVRQDPFLGDLEFRTRSSTREGTRAHLLQHRSREIPLMI